MIHQLSYRGRLDWAAKHLQSSELEIRRWSEGDPRRVWTQFDLQSGNNLIWAEVLKPPPNRIGFVLGDCLHNLRSALGNLAYELALAHQRGPLSKSMAGDSGFPIFLRHNSDSVKEIKRMTRGIHPDAKTIIEGLQPYNRWDENNPLLILSKLSNTDKHKLPHMMRTMAYNISYFTADAASGMLGITNYWRPFEGCAVIGDYPRTDQPYTEVDMQHLPTFTVAFAERAPDVIQGWGVLGIIRRIYNCITRQVVQPLIRYLA